MSVPWSAFKSIIVTRMKSCAARHARVVAVVVFPEPPLAEAIVIVFMLRLPVHGSPPRPHADVHMSAVHMCTVHTYTCPQYTCVLYTVHSVHVYIPGKAWASLTFFLSLCFQSDRDQMPNSLGPALHPAHVPELLDLADHRRGGRDDDAFRQLRVDGDCLLHGVFPVSI